MSLSPIQIPLTFSRDDAYTFARYEVGNNGELLTALAASVEKTAAPGAGKMLFVHGSEGAGKSHLLQAVCHAATDQAKTALYLSLADHAQYAPDILQGLSALDFVCLDDIEHIAGVKAWEEALFHAFNALRESGSTLVLAATEAPAQLSLQLPDLHSRLQWGVTYQVQDLSDHDKIRVLQARAASRNFDLPNEVGEFMIRRLPRDMHALCDMLDTLDTASLAAQRKLTVPFVRQVLDAMS